MKTEILVVNDCSIDKTAIIAKAAGVRLLDLPVNCGIGGAMQTGFLYALENQFDFAMQIDGDGQHPPQEIPKLLNCENKYQPDMVIGSRFIEKIGYQSSILRRMGISYLSWVTKLFTGKRIWDATSGFRLYNKRAIQLVAANYPDEYPEPQSLIDFYKAGLSVKEVPVLMAERQGGQSSISSFNQVYYLFKVTFAMFFSYIKTRK